MIYKIVLLSDEIDDFKRVITINADATFLDLHHAILDSVGYAKDQPTSFFLCDDDWTKLTEITLIEMDTNPEEDSYIMEKTLLRDGLEEEGQKFMYIFDYLTERAFYMELNEIIPGKSQTKAECIKSTGKPPLQFSSPDDISQSFNLSPDLNLDEDFYGDKDFDMDELDEDGFDGLGGFNAGNPYDDSY
ncbi:MAG: hypothetical protein FWD60_01720 [Candidatus Azobacteroides sp.]|nr:hypothetical protein [Candidatus Azobacteroides sp.]